MQRQFFMTIDVIDIVEIMKRDPMYVADALQCGGRFASALKTIVCIIRIVHVLLYIYICVLHTKPNKSTLHVAKTFINFNVHTFYVV